MGQFFYLKIFPIEALDILQYKGQGGILDNLTYSNFLIGARKRNIFLFDTMINSSSPWDESRITSPLTETPPINCALNSVFRISANSCRRNYFFLNLEVAENSNFNSLHDKWIFAQKLFVEIRYIHLKAYLWQKERSFKKDFTPLKSNGSFLKDQCRVKIRK